MITDVREESVRRILDKHPQVTAVADTNALIRTEGLDIYAPCALGGALNDESVPALTAKVVCGAANNQLAHPGVEKDLADRGILYAPDYVVNAGGVIQVADELHGFDFDRCKVKAAKIFDTTLAIFARAKTDGIPPPRRPTGSPSSGWRTPAPRRLRRARPRLCRDLTCARRGCGETELTALRRVARQERVKIAADQRGRGASLVLHRGTSCGRRTVWPRKQVPLKPYGRSLHGEPAPNHERVSDSGAVEPRHRGGRAMGRGRAKAKQTKVARQLKYNSGGTDLSRLANELGASPTEPLLPVSEPVEVDDDLDDDDPYAKYADLYNSDDDDDEDEESGPSAQRRGA